jgi:hypothetical protein
LSRLKSLNSEGFPVLHSQNRLLPKLVPGKGMKVLHLVVLA